MEHGTVSFIHQSVRDFLLDYKAGTTAETTGGIDTNMVAAETVLATTCIKFLEGVPDITALDALLGEGKLPCIGDVNKNFRG